MGCGKTTVGRITAGMLSNHSFADTDVLIEEHEGKSVSDIFASCGEQAFRDMETALLEKMLADKKERMVIATGGGMPVKEENRGLLKRLGTVFYLKASPKTIYERVKDDTSRPLLQCENPQERIEQMLLQRSPAYEDTADFVIDADCLAPDAAAGEIIRIYKQKGGL